MFEFLVIALIAGLLDRLVPDRGGLQPFLWYQDWVDTIEQRFNGGRRDQGAGAVAVALVPLLLAALVIRFVLGEIAWVLGFAFDVTVLYFCLDLSGLNHAASEVGHALRHGRLLEAQEKLRHLSGSSVDEEDESRIAEAAVTSILQRANQVAIAPLFWFAVLGPLGVLTQRLSSILSRRWGRHDERYREFGWLAHTLNQVVDWLPARMLAFSYAMVGNFIDAVHNWRDSEARWFDNEQLLTDSGFGALHLRHVDEEDDGEHDVPLDVPQAGHVRRAIALAWRSVLFWFLVTLVAVVAPLAS